MTPDTVEHGPEVVDSRPRELLEAYALLVGASLVSVRDGVVDLGIPEAERVHWAHAEITRLALAPHALDEEPEAELFGVGSPAFERLLTAIRARGAFETRGVLPPSVDPADAVMHLPVALDGAAVVDTRAELRLVPVGRILARVVIASGPRLEERLVESPVLDLATGTVLSADAVRALLVATGLSSAHGLAADGVDATETRTIARRPPGELLPMLFRELERELASDLARVRESAERERHVEIERIERYYEAMLGEIELAANVDDAVSRKQAIRAELQRRRREEEERFRVRVTLHPLQLTEWRVLAQRVVWTLGSGNGARGELVATRHLIGEAAWECRCPTCGAAAVVSHVCGGGHVSCPACSDACTVCSSVTCPTHGRASCRVDGHTVCAEHARTCGSCGQGHCTVHIGHCDIADHDVCPECAVTCARCATALCRRHGVRTLESAPLGARWLCRACTVACEGSPDEPVGLDEAERCTACERWVCATHRVACAVDGASHCSRHLRTSDRSGRLVCESHRATCDDEPGSVLAADEVAPCVTCARVICDAHAGICVADGARHCATHLAPLADRPGHTGCTVHRTTCHVDGVAFSIAGTAVCPVCMKPSCATHRVTCTYCARDVCVRDVQGGMCVTCRGLEPASDPPDELLAAALVANGGEPAKTRGWRTARDASATVVELDLGWTRRLVLTVRHGDSRPETVVRRSMFGARRVR